MAQIHTIKDDDQKDPPGREVNILPTRRVHIHMQATATKLLQQQILQRPNTAGITGPQMTGP